MALSLCTSLARTVPSSGEVKLTNLDFDKTHHSYMTVSSLEWSPDGTRILIAFRPPIHLDYLLGLDSASYNQKLFLVHLRNSQVEEIGRGFSASWSPDGSRIAVARAQLGESTQTSDDRNDIALLTMAPDGSDVQILVRYHLRGDLILERKPNGAG